MPLGTTKVFSIKAHIWGGMRQREVAEMFGTTHTTIGRICNGESHKDVQWPDGSTGSMPRAHRLELNRKIKSGEKWKIPNKDVSLPPLIGKEKQDDI